MKKELSDAEIQVMKVIWANPGVTGRDISLTLAKKNDWASGASYTLLGRCEKKGAVQKGEDGGFYPLISKTTVQQQRMAVLHHDLFDGSLADMLCGFGMLAKAQGGAEQEAEELVRMAEKLRQNT